MCSPFDIKRHVACEVCDTTVTGGYDVEANQVKLKYFNGSFYASSTNCCFQKVNVLICMYWLPWNIEKVFYLKFHCCQHQNLCLVIFWDVFAADQRSPGQLDLSMYIAATKVWQDMGLSVGDSIFYLIIKIYVYKFYKILSTKMCMCL